MIEARFYTDVQLVKRFPPFSFTFKLWFNLPRLNRYIILFLIACFIWKKRKKTITITITNLSAMCRMCGESDETISYIVLECKKKTCSIAIYFSWNESNSNLDRKLRIKLSICHMIILTGAFFFLIPVTKKTGFHQQWQ